MMLKDKYTKELIKIGKSFNLNPVDIDDVLYTLPEIILKFQQTTLDPKLLSMGLIPGQGYCWIKTIALKQLFPKLEIDYVPDFTHAWNIYDNKILDLTGYQYASKSKRDSVYAKGFSKQSEQFKHANLYLFAGQYAKFLRVSNFFTNRAFGWDLEK